MDCDQAKKLMALMLDGEPPTVANMQAFLAHIERCPSCRLLYKRYQRLQKGYSLLAADEPPTEFSRAWRDALRGQRRSARRALAMAASLVLVAGLGMFAWRALGIGAPAEAGIEAGIMATPAVSDVMPAVSDVIPAVSNITPAISDVTPAVNAPEPRTRKAVFTGEIATPSPAVTPVASATSSPVITFTPTPVITKTPAVTPTPVITATPTPSPKPSPTPSKTPRPTPSQTPTPSPTQPGETPEARRYTYRMSLSAQERDSVIAYLTSLNGREAAFERGFRSSIGETSASASMNVTPGERAAFLGFLESNQLGKAEGETEIRVTLTVIQGDSDGN